MRGGGRGIPAPCLLLEVITISKRFTDTEKWKKPFVRGLHGAYKFLWLYILDNCNHAGIWEVEIDVAILRINEGEIIKEKAEQLFKDKIVIFDNGHKWFVPSFIEFQYGELNEDNRVHKSILTILKRYKLNKGLTRPLQGCKDKDKDMDKDKDKDKDKDVVNIVEYWNTRDLPKCQKITPNVISVVMGAVKEYTYRGVVDGIENFDEAMNNPDYFENYKWDLCTFIKRGRGLAEWKTDGVKWQNYLAEYNKKVDGGK